MKKIYILLGLLLLIIMPMASFAYDGPGKQITLMTIVSTQDFEGPSGIVDGVDSCTSGNGYIHAQKKGTVWINLGAMYYVEGLEIQVRYEGDVEKDVGIYANFYDSMGASSEKHAWFNNNAKASTSTLGSWHRFSKSGGNYNAPVQFVKLEVDNIGYPSPMAIGEFKVYGAPAPGVELPTSSYTVLSQNNVIGNGGQIDNNTQTHAFVYGYQEAWFWVELDQEYPIAAVQIDLHSEHKGGVSLSAYAYGTAAGGTHEGGFGDAGPSDRLLAFNKLSGNVDYDLVPYSAQYPESNACGKHRTHWYIMTHAGGRLGTSVKYFYFYIDNRNNDSVICIDDIHIFRTYELTEDAIIFTGDGINGSTFAYDGNVHQPTVKVQGAKKSMVGGNITYPLQELSNTPYTQIYSKDPYADYKFSYPLDSSEPGVYTVTVEGVGIYSGTVTKNYYIKGASEIILDRDVVRFINVESGYNIHTVNIISTRGDGAITVESSDTSLFTATLSGMSATLKKTVDYKVTVEKTVYLTFRMAETETYAATSVTIPVLFTLHYLPVGKYVDLSTATISGNRNFGSTQQGIDTDAEILHLMTDTDRWSYALTKGDSTRSYFDVEFPQAIDLCDIVIRHATSFPGDIVMYIQVSDSNGNKVINDFGVRSYCSEAHRTTRVWTHGVSVLKGVKSARIIVDTPGLSGTEHRGHIYEIGFYSPITDDFIVEPNPEDRYLNDVTVHQVTQVLRDYLDRHAYSLVNQFDPHSYQNIFYAPQTKYFDWNHSGGTYGSATDGWYRRKSPYRDALCVLRDVVGYEAVSNGIQFMRGNITVCSGQDIVFGDNTTAYDDNAVEPDTHIITYTGDWQTGDGEEHFTHAKYVHVEEGKEAKATFNVYLAVSERIEITTDIGPYQGRAIVTLSKDGVVYCTDYIDGFFPVAYQNADTYKVSNMTGQAQNEINNYRNDYWHPGQVNTFTAPEDGVYTVEITVPWDSYLVSGLGGKYTTDAPANIPCTVINKVEKLKANEEWNFSFSDSQWFVVNHTENINCTVALDNGDLLVNVTGNDHHVYSVDNINIDASLYKGIEIIEKYDVKNLYYPLSEGGERQEIVQVFFRRTDMAGFSGNAQGYAYLPAAGTGEQYITHYINLEDNPEWYGTIRRLRFDLNNDGDGWHRIRAIRLVEK